MSNIYNDLAKYDLNGRNNIDTKTYDELKKTELRKKILQGATYIVGFVGVMCLLVNIPIGATVLFVSCVTDLAANSKRNDAIRLKQTLNRNQEQMVTKSSVLQNNIVSANPILKELKFFWTDHIAEIERLIEHFGNQSVPTFRYNKLLLKRSEKRWNDTIKECRNYSHDIRNVLEGELKDLKDLNQNDKDSEFYLEEIF